jgi:hypothetical protein
MREPQKTVLYWLPRVISILFAVFISLFALDVFDEYQFPEVLWALFMHMVPTLLVVIMLAVSWRREWIGTVLCMGLALFYLFGTNFDLDIVVFLLIPAPLIALSILWLLGWLQKKKYQQSATA